MASPYLMLSSLLHQILIFVQRHANYDFVKSLCTKDQVKWQIEAYHARIGVLVNAFQVGVRLVSLDIRRPKGDCRYQNCSISITGSCKMKQRERRIRRLCINDSTNCRRITAILLGFWVRLVDNMSSFFADESIPPDQTHNSVVAMSVSLQRLLNDSTTGE